MMNDGFAMCESGLMQGLCSCVLHKNMMRDHHQLGRSVGWIVRPMQV